MKTKSILLIGVGRFGRHMVRKLQQLGHEVWAVDCDEARVNAILPYVTHAEIGDATNEAYIASLGVRNFDLCVVAIGDNFQSSLEATSLLKEQGAKFVLSRASQDVQAKFLLRNGADKVIYPEQETGVRAAVCYSQDNVFDYVPISEDHSIYETAVPHTWIGHSIVDLAVRQKHHISILAVKRGEAFDANPKPDHVFSEQERLLILGTNDEIERFLKL